MGISRREGLRALEAFYATAAAIATTYIVQLFGTIRICLFQVIENIAQCASRRQLIRAGKWRGLPDGRHCALRGAHHEQALERNAHAVWRV